MTCDICQKQDLKEYVDGKTKSGPWANMCCSCYKIHGVGLGTGKGQHYVLIDGIPKKIRG